MDARLDDRLCGYRIGRTPRCPRYQSARAYPLFTPLRACRPSGQLRALCLLDPRAQVFFADWERSARDCVAILRAEAGRNPYDRDLSGLVGELSTQSEEFRSHWATHNVRLHNKGEKRFNHPVVGELELSYNRIELAADPGLTIVAYTAEPGSKSAEAFSLLASWAATEEAHEAAVPVRAEGRGSDR